eukprot:3607375-Pyramimonas_sp.AAC.1
MSEGASSTRYQGTSSFGGRFALVSSSWNGPHFPLLYSTMHLSDGYLAPTFHCCTALCISWDKNKPETWPFYGWKEKGEWLDFDSVNTSQTQMPEKLEVAFPPAVGYAKRKMEIDKRMDIMRGT